MRWDALFDDLEAQWEIESRSEERALVVDEERARLAKISLRHRLDSLGRHGVTLRVRLIDGSLTRIRPERFGRDWMVGAAPDSVGSIVIPFSAIASVITDLHGSLDAPMSAPSPADRLAERISFSVILRELSRRRIAVRITTAAAVSAGTIDRVGADHFDLAVHDGDAARRSSAVRCVELVSSAAVLTIAC